MTMAEIMEDIVGMFIGGLWGFLIGIVVVFYGVYKERPDLYAELKKWVFGSKED